MRTMWLACLLLLATFPAAADPADDAFERTYAQAVENEHTGDYDQRLAQALQGIAQVHDRWTACTTTHADKPDLKGYFEFDATGGYRVVLRPDNEFSRCIAHALEGQVVPEPPRRPYVHGMTFSMSAAGATP